MDNNLKLYLVKPTNFNDIEEVYAFFDSEEKAKNFLKRFKTFPVELEIVEKVLNPDYIINEQADPYIVTLWKSSNEPLNCGIYDLNCQAEAAQKEDYVIRFNENDSTDGGQFEMWLFAATAEEALIKAIAKRDSVIADGEWDKKHQTRNEYTNL